jgi:hypothetical protein
MVHALLAGSGPALRRALQDAPGHGVPTAINTPARMMSIIARSSVNTVTMYKQAATEPIARRMT